MSKVFPNLVDQLVKKQEVGKVPVGIIFDATLLHRLVMRYVPFMSADEDVSGLIYRGKFPITLVEPTHYEEVYDDDGSVYCQGDIDPNNPETYTIFGKEPWRFRNLTFYGAESAYLTLYHAETYQTIEFCIY